MSSNIERYLLIIPIIQNQILVKPDGQSAQQPGERSEVRSEVEGVLRLGVDTRCGALQPNGLKST